MEVSVQYLLRFIADEPRSVCNTRSFRTIFVKVYLMNIEDLKFVKLVSVQYLLRFILAGKRSTSKSAARVSVQYLLRFIHL